MEREDEIRPGEKKRAREGGGSRVRETGGRISTLQDYISAPNWIDMETEEGSHLTNQQKCAST